MLSGPFLSNNCEWGDSATIAAQSLSYNNYGIYDWDYFDDTHRVIGFIYEGDDGLHDDLIAKLDFTRDAGVVNVSDTRGNQIQFTANTHVSINEDN